MFIFLLFAVLNLSVGFATAVLLGYGPQPWYALFLPSDKDNVIHIDAIDSEEEPEAVKPAAAQKPAEPSPNIVSHPFPEMNEPEDLPAEPEPVAEDQPEVEETPEPVAEETAAEPDSAEEEPSSEEEDNELEEYLAGRKDKSEVMEEASAEENAPEIASVDDIESMFAATQASEEDESTAEDTSTQGDADDDDLDDQPLNQDDIAALFNS